MLSDEIRPVKIDHLAFTFPYSSLRHLDKSNEQDFINLQFPEYREPLACSPEAIEAAMARHKAKVSKILFHRLEEFLEKVFGFIMSPMRGRGLHGYEDSALILDKTRTVECGLIGIGGNNNTIFIQINGTGCTKLFDHITHTKLHWWLSTILGITRLVRLDLA
ncbi:TPA: replication initiation factor family protein, partial [Vibrio vulnificus]